VDIETDKVVLEVVAPADGTLKKILKEEGATVLAEELLAEFEAGEVVVDTLQTEDEPEEDVVDSGAAVVASPAARKMAEENRIDVTKLIGTGKGGRVTKEDIIKAVAAAEQQSSEVAKSTIVPSTPQDSALVPGERVERRVPMTRLRASIARRLVEAQQTAAM